MPYDEAACGLCPPLAPYAAGPRMADCYAVQCDSVTSVAAVGVRESPWLGARAQNEVG